MSNKKNGTLYVGVTSNLIQRICQHKNNVFPNSFTARYNIHNLVYYEIHQDINLAIEKEKKLKSGSRKKKIQLIESKNPNWNDLYKDIITNNIL